MEASHVGMDHAYHAGMDQANHADTGNMNNMIDMQLPPSESKMQSSHSYSGDHSSMMMQMWFTASASTTILFKDWKTEETWQILLSCFFWFIIAFLYEVLKAVRQEIIIRDISNKKCTLPVSSAAGNLDENTINHLNHCTENANGTGPLVMQTAAQVEPCPCIEASRSRMSHPAAQELVEIQMIPPHGFMATSWRYQMFSKCHLIQTGLHVVQMALSYILMLVVMTFNVWLFLAVILGFGAGYFVCGWWHCGPVVDPNEHCH